MLINCLLSLRWYTRVCLHACKDTKIAGLSPSASLTFASPKAQMPFVMCVREAKTRPYPRKNCLIGQFEMSYKTI